MNVSIEAVFTLINNEILQDGQENFSLEHI